MKQCIKSLAPIVCELNTIMAYMPAGLGFVTLLRVTYS